MRTAILMPAVVFFCPMAIGSAGATDLPAGDPLAGRTLAREICSLCHDVEPRWMEGAAFYGPAFADIAATPGLTAMRLRVFLRTPHIEMPDLVLTEQEADDVISYILSMRPVR